jgi:hypothetical protein
VGSLKPFDGFSEAISFALLNHSFPQVQRIILRLQDVGDRCEPEGRIDSKCPLAKLCMVASAVLTANSFGRGRPAGSLA